MSDSSFNIVYRLDQADRITEVGGAWDRMALENGGDALCGHSVLGRNLYDFISGDVSKMFVRTLIDGVRVLHRPRTVAYRCDSPGLRRYMEMSINCDDGGGVVLEHRQLRTEATGRRFDFLVGLQPVRQMVVRCSHCNSVKFGGVWGEPEALLPAEPSQVPVIYGVCPSCLAKVQRR